MEKMKILVCDDEEGVRESIKLILQKDYEAIPADSGEEALAILRQEPGIKAVLLDIKLPKIDGLDVLKQIKQASPQMPVIMITGYQTTETAAEAIKLGAFDYILKPINSGSVLSSIRRAL